MQRTLSMTLTVSATDVLSPSSARTTSRAPRLLKRGALQQLLRRLMNGLTVACMVATACALDQSKCDLSKGQQMGLLLARALRGRLDALRTMWADAPRGRQAHAGCNGEGFRSKLVKRSRVVRRWLPQRKPGRLPLVDASEVQHG
jgi:hypothetical protein